MHYLCIMFKRRVCKFIEEKGLMKTSDKVLVALSGGADSVALLRVLLSVGYSCECAHCNFQLRGEESERDESFVRQLCESLSVPLHTIRFDTESYASRKHISIEMAARELRYEWFETLRKETKATCIAVAHHRDDSVETFLLNLIRGTGINGLKGIAPKNGYIIRPLLQESREAILDYLNYLQQDYIVDSTNLQDEFVRNKIRLNLIPLMCEINPSVSESISMTCKHLTDVAEVYQHERKNAIDRVLKNNGIGIQISISGLMNEVAPQSLLFEILYPYGFQPSIIKDIYQSSFSQSGKYFTSRTHRLLRDRSQWILEPLTSNEDTPRLTYELVDITPDFVIPTDPSIACLDANKVTYPLTIRKWELGDKFTPLGMKGKKKVSDYLTDKKFTLFQKERQYVACMDHQIVWLIGERIDHEFRLSASSTQALIIRILP